MNYPIPLLLIIGPLVIALVIQGLMSRSRIAAIVGAVLVWGLARWITAVSLTETSAASAVFAATPLNMGQTQLLLTPSGQSLIVFLLVVLGGLFLLSLLLPQTPPFLPGSTLLIVPISLLLMIQDSLLRPPLMLLTLGMLAAVTQSRKPNIRTAMALLSVAVLGTVLLLVASGMQGETAVSANHKWFLLAAVMLLLGGFPFNFWIQFVAEKLSGPSLMLVFAWMPLVLITLLRERMLLTPALWQDVQFLALLQWSGLAAALLAALVIIFAPTFSRLVAGLLSLDMGITLLSLSIPGLVGEQTAVSLHLNRIFSLLIISIAWHWLKKSGALSKIESSPGVGRQARFSTFLFIFGCFSLIGLPITPGFSGRWALMASLSEISLVPGWVLILLLVAMVVAALGILRHLAVLVKPTSQPIKPSVETPWIQRTVAFLIIVSIMMAAFPQIITTYAARLVGLL